MLRGGVGDLDAEQEAHAVEERHQLAGGAGFHDQPGALAVVTDPQVVLDVAVRAEQQRLGGLAGGQRGEVLGGQRVQPGQPVGTADADDAVVGQVDDTLAGGEPALLAHRVAVVRRDAGVDARRGHRPVDVQVRTHAGCSSRDSSAPATRRSSAETCGASSSPIAAISMTHSRLPFT